MSKYPDVKDICTAVDDWGVAADDWGVAADDWVAGGDDWGKVAEDCGEGADDWDEGTNDWGEGADEFCDVDEDTHDGVDGTRYKEITAKIDSEPTDRESPSQDRNKDQCSSMVDATHYTALKQLCLNDVTDDVIDECQANTSHVVGEDIPSSMSELERSNIFQSFHVSDSAENGTDNVLRSYHINVFEEPAGLAEDNDHVSKLLKDYQKREGSNVKEMLKDLSFEGGGAMEKYERSALFHKDFVFHKFIKRLSMCPEQCIRYQWNGCPLLCGPPPSSLPRRCRYCGGEVVFELQLTPALINCLKFPQRIEPLKYVQHSAEPKQEWSYVDVREGAHMFYWLYYTTSPEGFQQAPLVMWLQGGPGGSGTGFGNFEEIGPLDAHLNPRNTTWLQTTSLLFVDNPVGTGYSYVDNKMAYTHDVAGIAADMMVTLTTFFMKKSLQFQEVPFYIFSESYGGKMTAAISQALFQNIQAGNITCNFKGLAMGDSWISPIDSTVTWAPYLYSNSLVDQTGFKAINDSVKKIEEFIMQQLWKEATSQWGSTQTVVALETNGVNFYNILKWGQEERSSLFKKRKDDLTRHMLSPLYQDSLAELMNGQIRKKLGIIPENVEWGGQSNEVFATQSEDFMKPVVDIVDDLIQNTDVEVVVYSGQLDLIVDTIGTEAWVSRLSNWDTFQNAERKPILDPITRLTSGFVKKLDNFSFYWILDAGHMVPSDNAQTALQMLKMIVHKT